MSEYIGFEVEISTACYGTVSGIVATCNELSIDLTNVKIGGKVIPQTALSFNANEIKSIKVLAAAANRQKRCQTSDEDDDNKKTPSSRELRRERLKKIPGAITAYVCDKSPPRVIKTPQPQMTSQRVSSFDDLNRSFNLKKDVKDNSFSSSRWKNANSNQSDSASGFESDSAASKHQKPTGRRSKVRGRRNSSQQDDCFSLRVEDFPDTDFDFESNLAKFDKRAFYEMTDAKYGVSSIANDGYRPECEHILIEGPNGISYVPSSIVKTVRSSTPVKAPAASPAPSFPLGSHWFTPSGKRVPFVAPSVLERALQFLATGRDPTGIASSLPLGLSWTRIIEMAGQAIVNNVLSTLKQHQHQQWHSFTHHPHHLFSPDPPTTPVQNQSPFHPLRVLVLPGRENWSGALALNLARHLANRDSACVLLHTAPPSTSSTTSSSTRHSTSPSSSSHSFPTYSEESVLAQTLAPQSSNFLLPHGPLSLQNDSSDDEESFEDDEVFSGRGDLKYSTRLLWTGRIPGLILVTKSPAFIARQLGSAHIDLLVLGQPLEEYPAAIRQWLEDVKGISFAIQLGAIKPPFRASSLVPSQALRSWVIQLGLPVASPIQVPESLEVHLVDVGLSKSILSRITTDQRSFPPPALFETSSCIRLMSDGSGAAA